MAGGSTGKLQVDGAGTGFMDLLKTMSREEILEILSQGLCHHCDVALQERVQSLTQRKLNDMSITKEKVSESSTNLLSADSASEKNTKSSSATWASTRTPESVFSRLGGNVPNSSPGSVNSKRHLFNPSDYEILLNDGLSRPHRVVDGGLSEEEKEYIRFNHVGRKKYFSYNERVGGKTMNVLQGLELHTRVFNPEEEKKIVESVYDLQRMGQKGCLMARTYSEPRKWMRGKGRITMQFGCCYNYAVDKDGNPPGIIRDEEVDTLPPVFKQMIKRMVRWHVLPPSATPNSCIVNIYEEGDCIPPHIDHHDFVRPFCTVSFLTECHILFGSNLKVLDPGEFGGPVSIPLPVGSVLILNGNGADVAKHCVPAVPSKRISITFRKMDESKLPYTYSPDPELLRIKPLTYSPLTPSPARTDHNENKKSRHENSRLVEKAMAEAVVIHKDDFPPLGNMRSGNRPRINSNGFKS